MAIEPDTSLAPRPSDYDDFQGLGLRGGDGSQNPDDSEEEVDEASDDDRIQAQSRSRQRAHAPRAANGLNRTEFQPGAIVRVKLQNFVTYEKAEFFLGPNLNMVIGPNGTGKSSLVCAICLGLGYPSHVLGRASAYGEFVKHGKDEADIQVELQRKPGERSNYVVGLTIRREDNSRKFTINNQRATHKDIQQLMKSMRIQIDNLCQFLPQDKVAEFAGLGPVELLEKTLQAAAPEEMIEWQKELKEHFKTQKEAQVSAQESNDELRKMESRQQVLQADVAKLRERKEISENIARLEMVKLVVIYNKARRHHHDLKKQKKEATRNLKRLQDNCAPSLQAVNRKQEYRDMVKLAVDDRKSRLRAAEAAAEKAVKDVEAAETKYQEALTKSDVERKGKETKRQEISKLRKDLTDKEGKYSSGAQREFDAADWNRRIRDKEHQIREKNTEIGDAAEIMDNLRKRGSASHRKAGQIKAELANFESQEGQLLMQLRKLDPHVAQGWDWLQDHRDLFEKEVFGPPLLNCSIKDSRYSDLVQSMLGHSDFLCFTTQTTEDHKKLSDQFYGRMGLQVTIRSIFKEYSSFKPPLPKLQLTESGLDGYMTDYLEGPEPVLAMLCSHKRIHQSGVALKDLTDAQLNRLLDKGVINSFAAGKSLYTISRRREYGPEAVSTRVLNVQKGRYWTDQPVDMSEKAELNKKLSEAQDEVAEFKKEVDAQRAKVNAQEQELAVIRKDAEELRKQKDELQREYNAWKNLPDKIDSIKRNLAQKRKELGEVKGRVEAYENEQDKAVLEKAEAVLTHVEKITEIRNAYQSLLEAEAILIEAASDVAALKSKNAEITQRLEQAKKLVDDLERQQEEARRIATEASNEAKELIPAEDLDEMSELAKGRILEDVEQEIGAEKAKLEVIHASNPLALQEYEKWATKIERERKNHADKESLLEELNQKIDEIRSQWEPRLDELVGKINEAFSYNFEQISCAGEVGVHKDEDFDKWAIEIKVKFRENETLQRLDQHRQSGGERAVSTIFYLMSLQSMAQAPFRVVDEINQGMDPRNERMVHERMVEIACREHTSQYFLITPKLLSGLRYDERMRVHTIVSGEYVDEEGTEKMNFARFVKIRKGLRAK
ncbi:SMC5-like protein [Rhypophila decipiens]|uniref:Structural maintenance of chromosomes protein 5 n=1 Tax=Rhypophila decipiens TaxID=261697 RepID=A0AAN6Y075_9PEZI|nr:SMC5-like protein [Rhypophila decipiens]